MQTRSALVFTAGLALAVMLGACGEDGPTTPVLTTSPAPAPTPAPTPTPTPTPPSVTGFWDSEARRWHFRLEQQGTRVTGTLLGYRDVYYSNPEHPDLQITGTVAGSQIDFRATADAVSFSGTVQADGRRMTGTLRDCAISCRNYGDVLVKAP